MNVLKRLLITGVFGFVGHYFLDYLMTIDELFSVYGIDVVSPTYDISAYRNIDFKYSIIDLTDSEKVDEVLSAFKPEFVLHLAAYSSVSYSWKYPQESFVNNTNIFLNLITSIEKNVPDCRVLSVGSSEEYGIITKDSIPIMESLELKPISPYAVARVAQEMLCKVYSDAYGLKVVMTRSFNHIGPNQNDKFVIPSIISKISKIAKSGEKEGIIEVGDMSIVRDFTDVRDVVEAYYKLIMYGKPGEIYNVCSGMGYQLREVVDIIAELYGINVETVVNAEYVRPNDNPIIIGSNSKIYNELNWKPRYSLRETIVEMINSLENG